MHGVLAQLGARIAGSDEVTGSNPVSSTIRKEMAVIRMNTAFFIIADHRINHNFL